MLKRILGMTALGLFASALFILFTPLGRQLTLCRIYQNARMELLQRSGMASHLRQQAKEWTPTATTPRAGWRFLKLQTANIPIPPGSWQVSPSTTTAHPLLTLTSKGNPEYSALLIGLSEPFKTEGGRTYQFFLGDLADAYEFHRELYRRDLSQPCEPRNSARVIIRNWLLMILKGLAVPPPGIEQLVYRHAAGFIAILTPVRQGKHWLVDTHIKPAGETIHVTYVVTQKANAMTLLDQLMFVGQKDLTSAPLPANLESIQRDFGR